MTENSNNSQLPWGSRDTVLFLELTPERVLEAVEQAGFRTTGRCLQLNSMENRVYEVEIEVFDQSAEILPRERFRVVKFYRPGRWSKQQLLEEHEFLQDLVACDLQVVSPVVLSSGSTLGEIPNTSFYFAVFPKVGGRNSDELTFANAQQLGRLIGRMHEVGKAKDATARLRLDVPTYGDSSKAILEEMQSVPVHLENRYFDIVDELLDISEDALQDIRFQRIHGDCHLGNILWGSEGCFLVDFDDMLVGPAIQDIWLMLPGRDSYAKRLLEQVIIGYDQMNSFDRSWLSLIEPLRALRMVHFSAWIAKRWQDESFKRTFPQFTSDSYWNEQIRALEEIVQVIDESVWQSS